MILADLLGHLDIDSRLYELALVLVCGIIGGELLGRLRLPKVTGWIATGILLRSLNVPGLGSQDLRAFDPFNYFVLGYIAFTVGATLYLAHLRNTFKRIGALLLCEAILTPLIVGSLLIFVGPLVGDISPQAALILAAIAIAGAPGTTVLVIQEARAKGILTRTLMASVGLIDMVAVGVFVFVSAWVQEQVYWTSSFQGLLEQFGITLVIGAFCASMAILLSRTIVGPAFIGPLMVAVILGSWGIASGFGTSGGILACTFAGIFVTNVRHDLVKSTESYLHAIGGVLFAGFYTFAGLKLDFSLVPAASGLVILYFAARLVAKVLSAYVGMSLASAPRGVRHYLGIALLPHGGVAVGLILLSQNEPSFEAFASTIVTVGLATLAINQLIGPSATRFALKKTEEDHKDKPRLLDFLLEQHIITDLKAEDRRQVFEKLVSQLYATCSIDLPQEELLKQLLENEELSEFMGNGLKISYVFLDHGDKTQGVLGLSSKGIDLDAPDGEKIHAVLLLATPKSEKKHLIEIMAAFSKAITGNSSLQKQLYHARSPAHAYEVLHAEDAQDVNYFLDEALDHYRDDQ